MQRSIIKSSWGKCCFTFPLSSCSDLSEPTRPAAAPKIITAMSTAKEAFTINAEGASTCGLLFKREGARTQRPSLNLFSWSMRMMMHSTFAFYGYCFLRRTMLLMAVLTLLPPLDVLPPVETRPLVSLGIRCCRLPVSHTSFGPPSLGWLASRLRFAIALLSSNECLNDRIVSVHTMEVPWGVNQQDNVTLSDCTIGADVTIVPQARGSNDPTASVDVWVVVVQTTFESDRSYLRFSDGLVFGPGSGVIIRGLTFPSTTPAIRLNIKGSFVDGALFSLSGLAFNADKSRPTVVAINGLRLSGGATGVIYNVSLSAPIHRSLRGA